MMRMAWNPGGGSLGSIVGVVRAVYVLHGMIAKSPEVPHLKPLITEAARTTSGKTAEPAWMLL